MNPLGRHEPLKPPTAAVAQSPGGEDAGTAEFAAIASACSPNQTGGIDLRGIVLAVVQELRGGETFLET